MEVTDIINRIPPQSQEAEQSVLGAMLLDREALLKGCEILHDIQFYKEAHRVIFKAITRLAERSEPADVVTVGEELEKSGNLEQAGGLTYLTMLTNTVPQSANIEMYAQIVAEKAKRRDLVEAAGKIAGLAYQQDEDTGMVLDKAENLVFSITSRGTKNDIYPLNAVITDAWDILAGRDEGSTLGIPSSYDDLDAKLGGFQPSDLIIIAGRTSMGKTTLALNILTHIGLRKQLPCVIFSLEMSKEQLALRMLCSEARINSSILKSSNKMNKLNEYDWKRITIAANELSSAPVFIDETSSITPLELRSKSRRLKAEHNIQFIIVDYLQLMQGSANPRQRQMENRAQEIADISRALKSLARELKVPVVALSQLSRAIEKRDDKAPQLSDLRESGAIEQDADVVLFIHRPGVYKLLEAGGKGSEITPEEARELRSKTRLIIAKHRNGPTGTIDLLFEEEHTKFFSVEKTHEYQGAEE